MLYAAKPNTFTHDVGEHYEKPMATKMVIHAQSATNSPNPGNAENFASLQQTTFMGVSLYTPKLIHTEDAAFRIQASYQT